MSNSHPAPTSEALPMSREYELVLLGATGYTGKLAAKHLALHAPTDLKWAVAGRSENRLKGVVEYLRSLNPDRAQPEVETFEIGHASLISLIKKARVVLSTVGPFMKYGASIIEGCAKNGTHYVDCSAEVPWHAEMIKLYDASAKASGAIIIPQTGTGSAPADLITYLLATHIRKHVGSGLLQVINRSELSVQPSATSLDAVISEFDLYGKSQMALCRVPFALSPAEHCPAAQVGPSQGANWKKMFGIHYDQDLGYLTDFEQSAIDVPLVQRSWGLLDNGTFYGPNFQYEERKRAASSWDALTSHLGFLFLMFCLSLSPVRWLLRRFSVVGEPNHEKSKQEFYESTAVGIADTPSRKRAIAQFGFRGSLYAFTGIFIAEAALTLLRAEDVLATKIGGGFMTPATLGHPYIDRLRKAGVEFDVWMKH